MSKGNEMDVTKRKGRMLKDLETGGFSPIDRKKLKLF
jgi:hypothetical protein